MYTCVHMYTQREREEKLRTGSIELVTWFFIFGCFFPLRTQQPVESCQANPLSWLFREGVSLSHLLNGDIGERITVHSLFFFLFSRFALALVIIHTLAGIASYIALDGE